VLSALLVATALLSQVFPAWRLDENTNGALSCPNPNELEAALAAQLQRSPTRDPGSSWRVSVSAGSAGPESSGALDVTLRDPSQRVRLSRVVPRGDGECADVADAVAFIVERFLRDLDWEGPANESTPPEVLTPSPASGRAGLASTVSSELPGKTSSPRAWGVLVGLGLRQGVAVEPQAEVGFERSFEDWRTAFVLSVPLAAARLSLGPSTETMLARQIVVSSWAGRFDLQRVWRLGSLRGAVGLDGLYVLDLARGEGFDSLANAPRSYFAAGMSGILSWQFSHAWETSLLAFADVPLFVQSLTIAGEKVAAPRALQAGGMLLLTFCFFS